MLAAHHDQENLLALRQGPTKGRALGGQSLQPKTPGARYPNTPLKIPLNDENAVVTIGKPLLGGGQKASLNDKPGGKSNGPPTRRPLATPIDSRRAPLGNKTTNARAMTGRGTTSVKDKVSEMAKTANGKATATRKQRAASPGPGQSKVKVLADQQQRRSADEDDIEYAPPRPVDLPYESDILPDGALTFEGLKRENLFGGYYDHFYNPMGEDGVRMKDRRFAESMRRAAEASDQRARQDMEELDWSVSDVPETKEPSRRKGMADADIVGTVKARIGQTTAAAAVPVSTVAARASANAISAISGNANDVTNKGNAARRPVATTKKQSSILAPLRRKERPTATASSTRGQNTTPSDLASRSTLGFARGRSASLLLVRPPHAPPSTSSAAARLPGGRTRRATPTIITSAITSAAKTTTEDAPVTSNNHEADADLRPDFTSIFDVCDDDAGGLFGCDGGGDGEGDEEDDEFVLRLPDEGN